MFLVPPKNLSKKIIVKKRGKLNPCFEPVYFYLQFIRLKEIKS